MSNPRTTTSVDRLVGDNIRKARKHACLTQTELGQRVGRTFQQIQKYEKGHNRVSAGMLFEIAEKLDKRVEWFFERDAA